MKTATLAKDAPSSTASASPAGSTPAQEEAANTGNVTASDVAAALGLTPEGQEADDAEDGADDEANNQGAEDTAGDDADGESDTADGDDSSDDEGDDPAESEDDAGSGDTAEESGADDTTEDAGDEAAGDEPDDKKPGKKNEQFQQRIDHLTAEKRTAQEEAAGLREKLATYQARDAGSLNPGVLDMVDTPEELAQTRARYEQLQDWAMANPDGGKMPDGKGGETEFSREEVAHIQAQANKLLTRAIPQREQYLAARVAIDAEAVKSYPWLADRSKGDGAAVQKAIEALPMLRRVPNHRLIAANAYTGEKLRRAGIVVDDALIARLTKEKEGKGGKATASNGQAAARRPAAPPPRAPAAPGRAGIIPPRRTPAAAEVRMQEKKLSQSSGSVDDIAASIAAKLKPGRR